MAHIKRAVRAQRWFSGPTTKAQGVLNAAAKLALYGAKVSGGEVYADNPVYCDKPIRIGMRTDPRDGGIRTLEVSLWGPCRKCQKCSDFKRLKWRERIMNELTTTDDSGKRSWFVTLTFSPLHLAGILAEARSSRPGEIERAAYQHVSRYFKRLRKWGANFRYCAVPEYGEKGGRLHFHVMIHETGSRPIPKSVLQTQWRSHVHAKLVDCANDRGIRGAASYLSKYATKHLECRPRASVRYGQTKAAPVLRTEQNGGLPKDTTSSQALIYQKNCDFTHLVQCVPPAALAPDCIGETLNVVSAMDTAPDWAAAFPPNYKPKEVAYPSAHQTDPDKTRTVSANYSTETGKQSPATPSGDPRWTSTEFTDWAGQANGACYDPATKAPTYGSSRKSSQSGQRPVAEPNTS